MLEELKMKMIEFYKGDAKRIQHFIKVHSFAKTIATLEGMEPQKILITEAAALVHDIGIRLCEEKYGECGGKLQEKEGPALAEKMLGELGFAENVIERVSYLVGHHHTYTEINDLDYQVLVEADFLVNIFEDALLTENARQAYGKIFKTETGRKICREMFALG